MAYSFRTQIAGMTGRQKEWFATALVAMVLADGNVSEGEVKTLMQCISFLQEPVAVERLKKHVQFQTPPPVPAFVGWEKEGKKKAVMMLDLMEVAIADQDLSPPEQAKFYEIGKLLGFNQGKIDQLIQAGNQFLEQS